MTPERKKDILSKVTLIEGDLPIPSYDIQDITNALTEAESEEFSRFINGQTGIVLKDGSFGVYKHDFDRFLDGLPVID